MRKILVPTDFSETSINALVYGLNLYKNTNTHFKIIHIYQPTFEPIQHEITDASLGMENVKKENMRILYDSIMGLAKTNNVEVSTSIDIGFTIDRLVELSVNYDLLIMGFTGANNFLTKVFGGISYGVVSKSKCPVLLIPNKVEFDDLKNIVFTANFESIQDETLRQILSFVKRKNAKLHFVHVENDNKKFEIELEDDIIYTFNTIKPKSSNKQLKLITEELNADMVIKVAKQRKFWDKIVHKSSTKELVFSTKTPLLIYHCTN